jgi:hypothetical protein
MKVAKNNSKNKLFLFNYIKFYYSILFILI